MSALHPCSCGVPCLEATYYNVETKPHIIISIEEYFREVLIFAVKSGNSAACACKSSLRMQTHVAHAIPFCMCTQTVAYPLGRYPPLLLALMLLHERSLGPASALHQYIADLPRHFDVPLHWAPSELAQLQYPPMAKEVRGGKALAARAR